MRVSLSDFQGRTEGAWSIAFEVLKIKSEIDFTNLFVFKCLMSGIILFIFNCLTSNINLFNFNCLNVKLLFSEEHIFRKQQRTVVYGRASLVSGFQLTRRNDDLLSSRHKQIFAVPHPVYEHTKMRISNKRYNTNTARIFWGPSFEALSSDHFGRFGTKICEVQVKLWRGKF